MSKRHTPRREVVTASSADERRTDAPPAEMPARVDPRVVELMHRQLRTSVVSALLLLALVGSLPLAFGVVPGLSAFHILGVGVAWIVLGVLVYPLVLLIGRVQVLRAEHHEGCSDHSDQAGPDSGGRRP